MKNLYALAITGILTAALTSGGYLVVRQFNVLPVDRMPRGVQLAQAVVIAVLISMLLYIAEYFTRAAWRLARDAKEGHLPK